MFARVLVVQMKSDKIDESTQLYKDSVVPAAKSQKGYRGIYMFTNRKTGKGMSISLWDSEADSIANEKSGYLQQQIAKFKDYLTAAPVPEGYEVSVKD